MKLLIIYLNSIWSDLLHDSENEYYKLIKLNFLDNQQ